MSLQTMILGYTGTASGLFEGVSPEDAAKYDVLNGPIVMAMEAASLFNEAFMEGFYGVNELEVEAAMESAQFGEYSSVMEGERLQKLKDKLKATGSKIAELFRRMGRAIRAFFSNVADKFRKKSSEADKVLASSDKKELKYFGYTYTHLGDIKDIIHKCTPTEVFSKIKAYSKLVSSGTLDVNGAQINTSQELQDQSTKALNDLKKSFGIDYSGENDEGEKLRAYFRNGKSDVNQKTKLKISLSEARSIVRAGAKVSSDLDNISKKMQSEYESYAKKAEEFGNKALAEDEDGTGTELGVAWMWVAKSANSAQTFMTKVLSSWNSAYTEATSAWVKAAGEEKVAGEEIDDDDNEKD